MNKNSIISLSLFIRINSLLLLIQLFDLKSNAILLVKKSDQVDGPISTGKLNTLLHLHIQPINPVVFRESHRDTSS
jgi:hypothetical protein